MFLPQSSPQSVAFAFIPPIVPHWGGGFVKYDMAFVVVRPCGVTGGIPAGDSAGERAQRRNCMVRTGARIYGGIDDIRVYPRQHGRAEHGEPADGDPAVLRCGGVARGRLGGGHHQRDERPAATELGQDHHGELQRGRPRCLHRAVAARPQPAHDHEHAQFLFGAESAGVDDQGQLPPERRHHEQGHLVRVRPCGGNRAAAHQPADEGRA